MNSKKPFKVTSYGVIDLDNSLSVTVSILSSVTYTVGTTVWCESFTY